MRKIVVFPFLFFVVLSVTGQQKNNKGEKMVAKLDILNYDIHNRIYEKSVISYTYSNKKMETVSKHTTSKYGGDIRESNDNDESDISYTLTNGRIKRVPVRNETEGPFVYTLNKDGKVIERKERLNRNEYIGYNYDYDENNRLVYISKSFYRRDSNSGYEPGSNVYSWAIEWKDGNGYVDCFDMKYSAANNDTNINLNVFHFVGNIGTGVFDDDGFEHSAEWYGMKSSKLLDEVTLYSSNYKMKYIYDNKKNLTEIVMLSVKDGKESVRKNIKVYY
jgi:hypothetical protein